MSSRLLLLRSLLTAALLFAAAPVSAGHTFQTFPDDSTEDGPLFWDVMDALPSGEDDSSARTVLLDFILHVPSSGSGPMRVQAQGETLFEGDVSGFSTAWQLEFPLFPNPETDYCCADIRVSVDQPGFQSGDQFLHFFDISMDWSQPIPEPGTALLVAGGLVALAWRRRAA